MRINLKARPFGLAAFACLAVSVWAVPVPALARSAPSTLGASDSVRDWMELKRFGLGNVNAISLSPDGGRIAVATSLGVIVRNSGSQRVERALNGHTAAVISVGWSPDGTRIASGALDSTVKIWDAASGALLRTLPVPWNGFRASAIATLTWSPDSSMITGAGNHTAVFVWNASTGALLSSLKCRFYPRCFVSSVSWSPDGTRIAAGNASFPKGNIGVWDVKTGALLLTLSHGRNVRAVAWSPDSAQLASAVGLVDAFPERTIKIWNAASGALLRTLRGHTGAVHALAWSPDGTELASGSQDHTVKIWNAAAGTVRATLFGHARDVFAVSWSAAGATIASASFDQAIDLWDAGTGNLINTLSGQTLTANTASWSPDQSRVASGYLDRTVRIWDVRTGAVVQTLRGHTHLVSSVAWSPDGSRLASGAYDGRIKIWDGRTGRLLRTLVGHSRYVTAVGWSPDSAKLASASGDSTIKIWDAGDGRLVRTLSGDQVITSTVAWSPDGTKIASSDFFAATINIWDAESGVLQKALEGHYWLVHAVAWSPDGSMLASAAQDSSINAQVKIWDAATGATIRTLRNNTGFVAVSWSPDGAALATGSWDGAIRIWSSATGKLKKKLVGHLGTATSATWSPDGRAIASSSRDGTVRIWGGADQCDDADPARSDEIAASPAFDPPAREEPDAAAFERLSGGDESVPRGPSFVSRGHFAVGDGPEALAVGDFDGDGILDVATANINSNDVSILLGTPEGKFRLLPQSFGAGLLPVGIAVGDFNGDGIPDLVVAQFGNSISVMLGNGDGTFQPAQDYQPGCCSPTAVAVADFDGDGIQDLAVSMGNQNSVVIFLGNGDGTFRLTKSFPVGFGPRTVIAGDFDGDGIQDLAVPVFNSLASPGPDSVVLLLGNGDGTFRAAGKVSLGQFALPWSITAGDFDGDGILDLAVANSGQDSVSVLLGKGDGTFQPLRRFDAGGGPTSIAAGAFARRTRPDGTSILDLATANSGSPFQIVTAGSLAGVSLLQGNGDGTFQKDKAFPAGTAPFAIVAGDFNGDGVPDLATANAYSNDVSILINVTPPPSANDSHVQSK